MKTIKEIRDYLYDIETDIGDCMTMPMHPMEEQEYKSILRECDMLADTKDEDLIETIKSEAQKQEDGDDFDYKGLLRWIGICEDFE